MSTFGETLQQYSYEYLLSLALSQVPNTVDKREGSIIYDALAPACYVLAEYFMQMQLVSTETYVLTATGENLENRTAEYGIYRQPATAAVKKATFTDSDGQPAAANIGNRFTTISETNPLYYTITAQYVENGEVVPGVYEATCETPGIGGQQYTGNIIPLDYLPRIATAVLTDTLVPGADEETDDELRARYIDKVNSRTFGGNIANYREMFLDIPGIGAVQIYPVWNGGGTVKVSIVDSTYNAVTADFISTVQLEVDPPVAPGMGIGKAPMDHKVTVVTPDAIKMNVSGTLTLLSGYSLPQVQPLIEDAIEAYLLTLRAAWGKSSELNEYAITVYTSQIVRAILSVAGVANVSGVTLNGGTADIVLLENSTTQQVPVLGEVTFNA